MARRIGAHVTISPTPMKGIDQALDLGVNTIQIFTHNPRGWSFKELNYEELEKFRAACKKHDIDPIISHCNYLINLATTEKEQWDKSIWCLKKELEYAKAFGCKYFVLHVGKHKGEGVDVGIAQVIKGLAAVKDELIDSGVMLLLETVAGQGTEVGEEFSELNKILKGLPANIASHVGVCMDTCHVFAAGYDIRSSENVNELAQQIESSFGFAKLKVIHANDSKGELGQNKDRHEHIGMGNIGAAGFSALFTHEKFKGIPIILETPHDDHGGYEKDLETLRKLI